VIKPIHATHVRATDRRHFDEFSFYELDPAILIQYPCFPKLVIVLDGELVVSGCKYSAHANDPNFIGRMLPVYLLDEPESFPIWIESEGGLVFPTWFESEGA
jgi:hypothetical protein